MSLEYSSAILKESDQTFNKGGAKWNYTPESIFNWYWLVDALMDNGYRTHLANPAGILKYKGLKYSNDRHDAFWLAHLLRLGILPERYIYPKRTDRCGSCCGKGDIWCN